MVNNSIMEINLTNFKNNYHEIKKLIKNGFRCLSLGNPLMVLCRQRVKKIMFHRLTDRRCACLYRMVQLCLQNVLRKMSIHAFISAGYPDENSKMV